MRDARLGFQYCIQNKGCHCSPQEGVEGGAPLLGDFRLIVCLTPPQMNEFGNLLGTPYAPVSKIAPVNGGPDQFFFELLLVMDSLCPFSRRKMIFFYQIKLYCTQLIMKENLLFFGQQFVFLAIVYTCLTLFFLHFTSLVRMYTVQKRHSHSTKQACQPSLSSAAIIKMIL